MHGDIVEYTTRYGDWYPNSHITEYHYTNQNDCKVCHYEKPYRTASESF